MFEVRTGGYLLGEDDASVLTRPKDDGGGPPDATVLGNTPIKSTGEAQEGPGEKPRPARTAMVYLPPMGSSAGSSLLAVTQRLADVASRHSPTLVVYTARDANESIRFGQSDEYGAPRCIITSRSAPSLSILDVYEFDYRLCVFGETDVRSPILKFLGAASTTFPAIGSLARATVARWAGRRRHREPGPGAARSLSGLQIALGSILALVLLSYVILLASAALAVVIDWLAPKKLLPGWISTVAIFLAGAVALLPLSLRNRLETTSARWVGLLQYLAQGIGRGPATGQLLSLLDELKRCCGYEHVDVLGVSLGSLVALDVLFPTGEAKSTVRPGLVETLVTVGCPHDTVRALHPNYFERRGAQEKVPAVWLNILNPLDVLSSNFRNDPLCFDLARKATAPADSWWRRWRQQRKQQRNLRRNGPVSRTPAPPTVNIAGRMPDKNLVWSPTGAWKGPTIWEALTFAGLRAHAMYWESRYRGDVGCLGELGDLIFKDADLQARIPNSRQPSVRPKRAGPLQRLITARAASVGRHAVTATKGALRIRPAAQLRRLVADVGVAGVLSADAGRQNHDRSAGQRPGTTPKSAARSAAPRRQDGDRPGQG
jgi:hypothetical protein